MKRLRISIFLILIIFLSQNTFSRDYGFPSLNVIGKIEADGSLYVEETRVVVFDGEYSGLFQWINKNPGEIITDVKVREINKDYIFNPSQEIGPAGTYFIIDENNKTYIDWSFKANNETRTFIVSYRIKNAVKKHNDVAELYYIFTGDEWDKPVGSFSGEIIFPENEGQGTIRAWGHGPLNGFVSLHGREKVSWEVNNIPSRTLVAGRVVFPLSFVPHGSRISGEDALDAILAEEENLADKANNERKLSLASIITGILSFIGSIVFSIFLWSKYGKEHKGDFDGEYYRELPSERPPAETGYLHRFKRIDVADITATILDLGRRGFLIVEEYEPEKKGFFKKKKTDYLLKKTNKQNLDILTKHERLLYDFLFNDVGENNQVTFEEIENFSKESKKEFVRFWDKWNEEVEKKMNKEDLFEKTEAAQMFKRAVPGFVLFVIPVFLFILFKELAIFAAIGMFSGGFIYIISLASHSRRTLIGAEENNKWKAFKKFIKDFSNINKEEVTSLVIWEKYLVYAVSLGVAKEALKALELSYPDLKDGNYTFGQGWYVYNSSLYAGNTLNASINSMTTSITSSLASTIAAATGQHSSGSGSGGGFSGGGGMGASGGGGGGAR